MKTNSTWTLILQWHALSHRIGSSLRAIEFWLRHGQFGWQDGFLLALDKTLLVLCIQSVGDLVGRESARGRNDVRERKEKIRLASTAAFEVKSCKRMSIHKPLSVEWKLCPHVKSVFVHKTFSMSHYSRLLGSFTSFLSYIYRYRCLAGDFLLYFISTRRLCHCRAASPF